jgi:streptomycin 6-kinase
MCAGHLDMELVRTPPLVELQPVPDFRSSVRQADEHDAVHVPGAIAARQLE